jgi:hypothetical protein
MASQKPTDDSGFDLLVKATRGSSAPSNESSGLARAPGTRLCADGAGRSPWAGTLQLPLPALPFFRPNHASVGVPCRMTRQGQGDDEAWRNDPPGDC